MGRTLEKEVEHLIAEGIHSKSLVPFKAKVDVPKQLDFFDPEFAKKREEVTQRDLFDRITTGVQKIYYANNITLSTFYELLSSSFYSGTMFNKRYVKADNGNIILREGQNSLNGLSNYEELIKLTKPDLINQETHWIGEVKAFRSGKPYKFRDDQMASYFELQRTMPLDTKLDFIIYRHTVRDFPPTEKNFHKKYTDESLFAELARHTVHSIVIPFNLVSLLHELKGDSRWVYRDEGVNQKTQMQMRDPGTCLRSPSANKILVNPEEFLEEHGLNPEDYQIERLKSPDNFYFGDYPIKPFPITILRYKKYSEWADNIRKNYVSKYFPRSDGGYNFEEADEEILQTHEEVNSEEELQNGDPF